MIHLKISTKLKKEKKRRRWPKACSQYDEVRPKASLHVQSTLETSVWTNYLFI